MESLYSAVFTCSIHGCTIVSGMKCELCIMDDKSIKEQLKKMEEIEETLTKYLHEKFPEAKKYKVRIEFDKI